MRVRLLAWRLRPDRVDSGGRGQERIPQAKGPTTSMPIELTEHQQQALDAIKPEGLATVVDPRTRTSYVLIPAGDYEAVREVLEDERQQRAIRRVGLRNAVGRMDDEP